MILKATSENNNFYNIMVEKRLLQTGFNAYVINRKNEIVSFVASYEGSNIASFIKSIKAKGYKITIEKSACSV